MYSLIFLQPPAITTQILSVDSSPVVAVIAGGSFRTVQAGGSLLLDSSLSFDPDRCSYVLDESSGMSTCAASSKDTLSAGSQLSFSWTCSVKGVPCRRASNANGNGREVLLGSAAQFKLDLGTLDLPEIPSLQIIVTVSVGRLNGGEVSMASVTINVSQSPTLDLQIVPLYDS